uniref:Uncharacterized protein LOC111134497 isoform X3 n=1 Tax=Crassostrea virginica TaxID=6565 RepID=A0A8B8EHV2_CRAVI|nr:uncharacterized protein LOC111134497 isoform X3 [Crassostrea virginica]XP_022339283.1 uncharacterized protein LOC111134497 isoform X3 [Crassostrea virginica]XP_022339284.1 uncharacterized protein LOC111134497 isoform X3 [Crassostrea virginica]
MIQFRAIWSIIKMFRHRYRKQLIVITGILIVYWMQSCFYREVDYIFVNKNTNQKCVIPNMDPLDKSILQFYLHLDPVKCEQTPDLVFVDSKGVLHVNQSAVADSGYRDVSCSFSVIKRLDDYEVKRETEVHFGKSAYVEADFFLVKCKDDEFRIVYEKLHHTIDYKSQMQHHKLLNDSKKHLNVYIVGMDSLSRLAAERTIPITLRYIEQDLGGYIMKGYTKVGVNTFPNLVSLLTGKVSYSNELPPHVEHLDPYPFIWKNFSNSGYATMFSEDLPDMGTFTYWKGFKDPPTMHYMRPFYVALDTFGLPNTKRAFLALENNNINLGRYSALCVKNTPKHHFYMNYYKQFIEFYGNKRKFALGWLNELTHEYDNLVQLADRDYMLFFKWLKESGRLDHSILILMSDHGIMQKAIKNTLAGRTENRMPIFAIVIPPHLKTKYPHIPRNLNTNTKRLTTVFDVHEMLVDILESDFQRSKNPVNELAKLPRGISLFREIPERRSCDDAAIPGDYCVCDSYEPMDAKSAISKDIGQFLVSHINQALSKHGDKCAILQLSEIKDSFFVKSNLQRRRENEEFTLRTLFRSDPDIKKYLNVFETRPGNALFEALVSTNDNGSYDVIGRINRVNKYGNQSWCIDEKFSKPLCFCI